MFRGCGTALVTPFRSDLSLDEPALRRLLRRQIDAGIHFLVPCGTTGENPTLTRQEHLRVVEITLEEAGGKVPILAGAGGNDTREVVALARAVEALGADGLLVVTPYYNKPTPDGLVAHYHAVSEATRLPIVVYNVPGRTGTNVEPATLLRLSRIERVVGVKEASGNISQFAAIFQTLPESFAVLSGDDALTVPLAALGGVGLISVASNEMPGEMARMTQLAVAGDFAGARAIHRRLHRLMEINFIESNPGPVKAALALMGLIEPVYRLPAVPVRPESLRRIEAVLAELGLLPGAGAGASAAAEETAQVAAGKTAGAAAGETTGAAAGAAAQPAGKTAGASAGETAGAAAGVAGAATGVRERQEPAAAAAAAPGGEAAGAREQQEPAVAGRSPERRVAG